jgi:ATP-dependent protease ClpP protease subunit
MFTVKFFITLLIALFTTAASAKEVILVPERTIVLGGVISDSIVRPMIETMTALSKTGKEVNIIISSPGGSVIAGNRLVDRMVQIKNDGVKFRCFVRDLAASMAFQFLLFCDERYATPHAFLLWHPVRIFAQGVITAQNASNLATQLGQADEVALHDLRAHMSMPEADLVMHFYNETLHQALNLQYTSPGFFTQVTNNVSHLYPQKPALDTSGFGNMFDYNQIVYIHEQFLTKGVTK